MPKGETPNPMTYEGGDDNGNNVVVRFPWDTISRLLGDVSMQRDDGCPYQQVQVGVGDDGFPPALMPDGTPRSWTIPEGVTQKPAAQINDLGLTSIDDLLAEQVVLGFGPGS